MEKKIKTRRMAYLSEQTFNQLDELHRRESARSLATGEPLPTKESILAYLIEQRLKDLKALEK